MLNLPLRTGVGQAATLSVLKSQYMGTGKATKVESWVGRQADLPKGSN
jgi:hypothetical protein